MHQCYAIGVITLCSCFHLTDEKLFHGPYHQPPKYENCPSEIYCKGDLLNLIQTENIFHDSKMFVDMSLKQNESTIMKDFKIFKLKNDNNVSLPELKKFVTNNFEKDDQLDDWIPPDFKYYPTIIEFTQDKKYKEFLMSINQMWRNLAKKVPEVINKNQKYHSLIYIPNGFFVNDLNQKEFNYWDTYFIIRGALICGMDETVKGILENVLYIVKKYGYMLYGNRVYYEQRSQPPLLTQMMATYYTYTNDKSFIVDNLWVLDDELMFWLKQRLLDVRKYANAYKMAFYKSISIGPRPESYFFDTQLAKPLNDTRDKQELFNRIKSASESGWGFSSKHFHNRRKNDNMNMELLKTNPMNFVYVELNAILQSSCNILSKMFLLGNLPTTAEFYKKISRRFQIGINSVLWNVDEKMWLDYDISKEKSRNYFYASNLAPLWTGSYDNKLSEYYGDAAVDYLIKNNIINNDLTPRYLCVPTSLYDSGLDWDHTKCWPQLQSMVIFGLRSTRSERAQTVALNLAKSWVHTNYVGYNLTKTLFSSYSAVDVGKSGSNNSPYSQKGCGVTNGLLFDIFHEWGDILESEP